ncbi:MAG: DEAD/DEAH box helicase [Deltaproteobacteria bacterium]|nr:DEAD/DEAH box helicase [Deltaproteobacteria bacterium]
MNFSDLKLPEPLLRAVADMGFETPTPIQAAGLPKLLTGADLAGQAQTGTGKTACFLLGTMTRLLEVPRPEDGSPRALIVAPTRELAIQIASDAEQLAVHTALEIGLCYGGVDWDKQASRLRDGVDIVVGTPGRLLDFYRNRVLRLGSIESFVLDEADRMFDMGFIKDITSLFRAIPPKHRRQSMLFSATLNESVMRLAYRFMNEPVEVSVTPDEIVLDHIEQELYHVASHEKMPLLLGLMKREQPQRTLVFVNTKRVGEELTWRLNHNGYQAAYMSGDIPQKKRQKIIGAFREGKIDLLVATDVASRGIHVDDITHVFNYDVPDDAEDYVHRIGRTARAGAHGKALTFCCEDYAVNLPGVERYIDMKVPTVFVEDVLIEHDRAGRFPRQRGRVYTGWPPEGDRDDERADAGGADGGRDGGRRKRRSDDKPAAAAADGGRKRSRRRKDGADGRTPTRRPRAAGPRQRPARRRRRPRAWAAAARQEQRRRGARGRDLGLER